MKAKDATGPFPSLWSPYWKKVPGRGRCRAGTALVTPCRERILEARQPEPRVQH